LNRFLQTGPLSTSQDIPANSGAVATFSGIIRADKTAGKVVSAIEYSAFEPMAEKIFRQIHDEILARYDIQSITIKHSIGILKAGESSMLVEVHSKHRAEAFDSLREAVELIKEKAPVWKKEIYEDGTHNWVNAETKLEEKEHG